MTANDILTPDHQQLLKIFKGAQGSLSISQIQERLPAGLQHRTILRRINDLIDLEVVQRFGERRGVRYILANMAMLQNIISKIEIKATALNAPCPVISN